MTLPENPNYLNSGQYRDASNLNARIEIHRRFSVNPYGWARWLFDLIGAAPASRVLELGCGPANLWSTNLKRTPISWEIILTDFSPGMVAEARRNLGDAADRFRFEVVDAQEIPNETVAARFGLETGAARLAHRFAPVTLHRYEDALEVTEREPLVAYVRSSIPAERRAELSAELAAFADFVDNELAARGVLHLAKASGLFQAVRPLREEIA
jgi:SAM-dependent methyltransferase